MDGDYMAQIYDISVPLNRQLAMWPGSQFKHRYYKHLAKGDTANVSQVTMSVHTGTHVDAPYHHLEDGYRMGEMELDHFIGPATVYDLSEVEHTILPEHFAGVSLDSSPICLLKTRNSGRLNQDEFDPDYVYLSPEVARYLVEQKVRVVGIDYLSVEHFYAAQPETHQILLQANIVIVEGLNLEAIAGGQYFFICLPLNIPEAEAAPARAVLLDWDNEVRLR